MSPERIRPGSARGGAARGGAAPDEKDARARDEAELAASEAAASEAVVVPEDEPRGLAPGAEAMRAPELDDAAPVEAVPDAGLPDVELPDDGHLRDRHSWAPPGEDADHDEDEEADARLDAPPTRRARRARRLDAPRSVPAREEADDLEVARPRSAPAAPAVAPAHHSFFRRLYFGETNFDFVGRRRLWFTFSALLIVIGAISLGVRGLNLDIEFVGGTSWTVQSPTLSINAVRTLTGADNIPGATITILGNGSKDRSIQIEAKIPKGQTSKQTEAQLVRVQDGLASLAHVAPSTVSIESVGPSWGGEVTTKAVEALVVFFILVALYISIFFEWRMALAAIIAVIHDIAVVVGIYSLTGFDVTPDTVVAILTILGYSLYDTIVVFDRVRDNLKAFGASGRLTVSDLVNLSMNQTLARSVNTSLVAVLPIFAVLILGAEILGATTLQYFGWALLIGLTSGAYSSIFIASPIVAELKEREPRWQRVRERLAQRGGERLVLSPAAVAAGLFASEAPTARRRSVESPELAPGQAPTSRSASAARRGGSPSPRRPSGGPRRKGGRR